MTGPASSSPAPAASTPSSTATAPATATSTGDRIGIRPERSDDPARVRELVRRDGAAVLTGCDAGEEAALGVARSVFGDEILALPPAAPIRPGPETAGRLADDGAVRGIAHTDGYAYGDALPDHFMLLVDHQCPEGGANFLVDGWALLDELSADPATSSLAEALTTVPIDQTEPGMRTSLSPVVLRGPDGAPMVRRTKDQRPAPDSRRPLVDAAMIGAWHAAVEEAARLAPSVRVESGEAVVVDNRRVFHGRETYTSPDRLLWRVWVWTGLSLAVPDGPLHSDRRFAGAGGAS